MPIEGIDYFVRVVPFPPSVPNDGMVMENEDGTYSIYLNERMPERWKTAIDHEIDHIKKDDMHGPSACVAEHISH